MADPVTLGLLGISAVMGGVSMFSTIAGAKTAAAGQQYAGAAQAEMYQYQAMVSQIQANVEHLNSIMATSTGEQQAQISGLASEATVGKEVAQAGAANVAIGTGSTAKVVESQLAIGRENQAIARSNAAQTAYGFEFQSAESKAAAGEYTIAAGTAPVAAGISSAGTLLAGTGAAAAAGASIASTAANAYSVSSKWNPTPPTAPVTGQPLGAGTQVS